MLELLADEVRRESRRLGGDGTLTLFTAVSGRGWIARTTTRPPGKRGRYSTCQGTTAADAVRLLLRELAALAVSD